MKPSKEAAVSGAIAPGVIGQVARVAAGVLLLTLCAKVQVPFWPVPMTLQVAAVMLLAGTFGMRVGLGTVLAYLAAGAMGFPVFAGTPEKGIGLAYMVGPTGGYLIGFVLAAGLVGYATERLGKWMLWPAMLGGLVLTYGFGLAWLARFVPGDQLLAAGFLPFIAGDLLKISLAALIVLGLPAAWRGWLRGGAARGGGDA